MRWIELRFRIPFTFAGVRIACAMLTTMNRWLLRVAHLNGQRVPGIYESGVRYLHPSGPERWDTFEDALRKGTGDCKVLACWRAAELLEAGQRAHAIPVRQHEDLFHIVVRYENGQVEDPSKRLGMGQRRRVACSV